MMTLLTLKEELELGARIADGCDESLEKLVRSNLPYVRNLAYRYRSGQELEDLIAAGNLGLVKAARSYDHKRGNRFLSYAHYLIVKEIIGAISAGRFHAYVPHWIRGNSTKITIASDALKQRLHREPSMEELAEETGLPVERVIELNALMQGVFELDQPLKSGDSPMETMTLQTEEDTTVDPVIIKRLLSVLTKQQQAVVKMHVGMGCDPMTFEEIGKQLNVTRARVWQIFHLAIKRMKNSDIAKEIMR